MSTTKINEFKKILPICPNCRHSIYRCENIQGIKFCPHCQVNLLKTKTDTEYNFEDINAENIFIKILYYKFSVKTRLILSTGVFLISFLILYVAQTKIFTGVRLQSVNLIFLTLFAFLLLIKIILEYLVYRFKTQAIKAQSYKIGVDDILTVKSDQCDYGLNTFNPKTPKFFCKVCHSQRLVTVFWFKRILAKNSGRKQLPYIPPNATDVNFLGCLNCEQTYKVKFIDNSNTKVTSKFMFGYLGFWLTLILFHQQITDVVNFIEQHAYAKWVVISLWFGLIFFNLLTPVNLNGGKKIEPVCQLKKLNTNP